jgi:hypothetical protein
VFSQLGSAALNAIQWQTNYSTQNSAQNQESRSIDTNYNFAGQI